jgi:REP element-mobilizing transposase RayT
MYGFWLPNDPRGSWSDFVGSWDLFRYGPANKAPDRRSVASKPHDVESRLAAKNALKRPPVILTGVQALSVARGFSRAAESSNYKIHARAILPEHIHLVIGRHHYDVEQVVRRLKQFAGQELSKDGLHPFAKMPNRDGTIPSPFCARLWKCFIDSNEYAQAAVRYVETNPIKEGLKQQRWSLVTPWDFDATRDFSNRG